MTFPAVRFRLALVVTLATALAGCSILPRRGAERDSTDVPDAATAADSAAVVDSAAVAVAPPTPAPPPESEAPPEPKVTPEPGPVPPAAETSETPAEAELAQSPGEVQVELSAEERLTLAAEARKDLEQAEAALRAENPNPADAERREKLDTIRSLIDSAKAAYGEDLRAAATLAHKARLLAEELSGS